MGRRSYGTQITIPSGQTWKVSFPLTIHVTHITARALAKESDAKKAGAAKAGVTE